jgi:hypothetical protein
MPFEHPIVQSLPATRDVRDRLGDALREVELLRRLLPLCEKAELYRRRDREVVLERAARKSKDPRGEVEDAAAE